MRPFSEMGDEELGAALRALRPQPSAAFAAELDQRVAAGFPRRSPRRARNPFARAFAWLRAGSAWRLAIPAGGVSLVAIAAATVLLAGSSWRRSHNETSGSSSGVLSQIERFPQDRDEGAGGSEEAGSGEAVVGGEGAGAETGEAGGAQAESLYEAETTPSVPGARGPAHRDVERAAEITIGTRPGEVDAASAQVFQTVHRYDGVVLDSSTQNGSGTRDEASFELLLPSGRVGDAMAAFTRIGEVVSRHETSSDITAPTVGAGERLQDSEARIDGLLAQLAEATAESEREVVEAELDSERRHAAHLKARLHELKQRAHLSRVSVRIASGRGVLVPGGASGGRWSVGDAVEEAGHLLGIAAGVAIVALAVLAPLALVLFLVWLAGRAWTRRARERALT